MFANLWIIVQTIFDLLLATFYSWHHAVALRCKSDSLEENIFTRGRIRRCRCQSNKFRRISPSSHSARYKHCLFILFYFQYFHFSPPQPYNSFPFTSSNIIHVYFAESIPQWNSWRSVNHYSARSHPFPPSFTASCQLLTSFSHRAPTISFFIIVTCSVWASRGLDCAFLRNICNYRESEGHYFNAESYNARSKTTNRDGSSRSNATSQRVSQMTERWARVQSKITPI